MVEGRNKNLVVVVVGEESTGGDFSRRGDWANFRLVEGRDSTPPSLLHPPSKEKPVQVWGFVEKNIQHWSVQLAVKWWAEPPICQPSCKNFISISENINKAGAQVAAGKGVSPALLWKKKKVSWFFKKSALLVCIYDINSNLKCSFKSILEKTHQDLSLRDHCFVCRTWKVYWSAPFPKHLPCIEKFLVARLRR